MHLGIGTVAGGLLFAFFAPSIPGPYWLKGIIFAAGAWLLMMIALIPMAGKGLFGMQLGPTAPMATLMLHIVFGVVLGGVYAALLPAPAP